PGATTGPPACHAWLLWIRSSSAVGEGPGRGAVPSFGGALPATSRSAEEGPMADPQRLRRSRWASPGGALLLLTAACTGGGSSSGPSAEPSSGGADSATASDSTAPAASTDSKVCGYLYEWLSAFRFPLQLDPHAAYSYVVPQISNQPVALEITGDFAYAA